MGDLSAGKLRGLTRLADDAGRFTMMAIDQRGSLIESLAKSSGRPKDQISFEDVARVKRLVTRELAPLASGVLTDPVYGYPYSIHDLPRGPGLLLTYEETHYDTIAGNRYTKLIEGWSVFKALSAGADAVKVLLYYHPDGDERARRHQQDLVRRVGQECAEHDIAFVLELVAYALDGSGTGTPEYARAKPDLVIRSAREFSRPDYQVDLLKLEFPANLKYCREFQSSPFGRKDSPPVYDLHQVKQFCRELDEAADVPWVILSAGVDIEEFIENTKLAVEAGASGFLAGRAIWKDAVAFYPDEDKLVTALRREARSNFQRLIEIVGGARPWFAHRRFGTRENIRLRDQSPAWYRQYQARRDFRGG
jgi:tagatose 1,6-diphosphate aldolase